VDIGGNMNAIGIITLIEELQKYPADSLVYAYEGEITGVVIISSDGKQLGAIETDSGLTD
jgi:hypothetical protein